jgi:hypothetical protein
MATIDKLASLLVDAVNEADELANETGVILHRVQLRLIRNDLDNVLRRVQRTQEEAKREP